MSAVLKSQGKPPHQKAAERLIRIINASVRKGTSFVVPYSMIEPCIDPARPCELGAHLVSLIARKAGCDWNFDSAAKEARFFEGTW